VHTMLGWIVVCVILILNVASSIDFYKTLDVARRYCGEIPRPNRNCIQSTLIDLKLRRHVPADSQSAPDMRHTE
jgi:hypothetical protein